jgi:hypothetical protein
LRIWSLHPKYLDQKGLVALWREGLLAQKVLENKTKGYRNHPQLARFKNSLFPLASIGRYLDFVYLEAAERGYNFDRSKIIVSGYPISLEVTQGQLMFEWQHLLQKLKIRDKERFLKLSKSANGGIEAHPIFRIISGDIETWEKNVKKPQI